MSRVDRAIERALSTLDESKRRNAYVKHMDSISPGEKKKSKTKAKSGSETKPASGEESGSGSSGHKKKQSGRVEYDPAKHDWITVNGARVMVNKNGGDIVGGAEPVVAHSTEADKGATPGKVNDHVDKLFGGSNGHGFKASEDKDGNTVIGHEGVDEHVPVKGPGLFDTITAMTSYVDVLTAATMQATGALARRLGKSLEQLIDVLKEYSGG